MELSASITPLLCPTVAFMSLDDYSSTVLSRDNRDESSKELDHWQRSSALNPCNRLESGDTSDIQVTWRIDGCTSKGTQFFAVPSRPGSSRPAPLRRIDVYIPDQAKHSPVIRDHLKAVEAIYAQGSTVCRLPIARYIVQVLARWSNQVKEFDNLYKAMPFGSRIVIQSISTNPENARVRFYPMQSVEDGFLSVGALHAMWPHLVLPPQLHIDQLELITQLHDTVGLVRIPSISCRSLWVFKCRTTDTKYLYHELKMLLSLDKHDNMLPKPEFLIVQQGRSFQSPQVLGMIITYYPLGNLGRMIERRRREGNLDFKTKLGWAKQLSTVLAWLTTTPMGYYSELKPDNIICTGPDTISLIDMEQYGNWETFTAPEVYHVENLARLSRSNLVPVNEKERYRAMFLENVPQRTGEEAAYSNPDNGYFDVWNVLSSERQEAAMVYALGKVMWCIFEGWSHTVNTLDEEYTDDCGWEFPEFHDSPPEVQCIISDCTKGSPDWIGSSADRLVRVETKIYPKGHTGRKGEPQASSRETVLFSKAMWAKRLESMERYIEAKLRWEKGNPENGDAILLGFPLRPRLKDILARLKAL